MGSREIRQKLPSFPLQMNYRDYAAIYPLASLYRNAIQCFHASVVRGAWVDIPYRQQRKVYSVLRDQSPPPGGYYTGQINAGDQGMPDFTKCRRRIGITNREKDESTPLRFEKACERTVRFPETYRTASSPSETIAIPYGVEL